MVDVQHHQSVQMAVLQQSATFLHFHHAAILLFLLAFYLVKEVAAVHEGRQLLLQFLSPEQQLFFVTLFGKGLDSPFRFKFFGVSYQELLVVRVLQPGMDSGYALPFLVSSHSRFHGSASINMPGCLLAFHFLPEVPSAAFRGRGLLNIFLVCNHEQSVFLLFYFFTFLPL